MVVITILIFSVLFVVGYIFLFCFSSSKKMKKSSEVSFSDPKRERNGGKLEELERVFSIFDKNKDGFITKEELRESMKSLKLMMSEKEVEEMVEKVDVNGDGLVEFGEFCELFECSSMGFDVNDDDDDDDDELKEVFEVFDKDKDGLISEEELGLVLLSLGLKEGRRVDDCKEMIKKVDLDGDGMVDFNEFKRMMKNRARLISIN